MRLKAEIFFSITALALAACGGGGGSGSGGSLPGGGGGPVVPPGVGINTIGLALPPGSIGQLTDPSAGIMGGFTQTVFSQRLGFAAGTTVTIKNVGLTTHTFNVIGTSLPFATAPSMNPAAPTSATIGPNYASGNIAPGASVTLTLTPGTWLIGCFYHFLSNNMRTVLTVPGSPGPQATPVPSTGGGNPCPGGYC
ncbi:MAG: hypothetical protein M3160_01110 [Candidatus Eremiobacteraeota bacterium]|nr:hypothetical protein [Candidatus Eremiobacteraeota bacterium]